MNENKAARVSEVKQWLLGNGLFVRELPGGQLQVDGVNLWATTGRWHDPRTGQSGHGENSFLEYVTRRT